MGVEIFLNLENSKRYNPSNLDGGEPKDLTKPLPGQPRILSEAFIGDLLNNPDKPIPPGHLTYTPEAVEVIQKFPKLGEHIAELASVVDSTAQESGVDVIEIFVLSEDHSYDFDQEEGPVEYFESLLISISVKSGYDFTNWYPELERRAKEYQDQLPPDELNEFCSRLHLSITPKNSPLPMPSGFYRFNVDAPKSDQ